MQTTSRRGLAEIASHEAMVLSPYFDSVGVRTIGIGHTKSAGAPDPAKVKGELTVDEVMDIFMRDIAKFEARVRKAFGRELPQHQFDAAVSFDFNTGAIHRATWVKEFNQGNTDKAWGSFMNWRKPSAIIPRREKERALFFKGEYSSNGYVNTYPVSSKGKVLWGKGKRVKLKFGTKTQSFPEAKRNIFQIIIELILKLLGKG